MRGLLAALVLMAPAPALAQAWQCAVPGRIDPLPAPVPDGPKRKVPIGGFTLAVSWSPEYCRGSRDPGSMQCSGKNGRFGFVLHGLWPEASFGPPPQWCSVLPRPQSETVRKNMCVTPVPRLIEHEWAKHGSCMATTPEAYWAIARHIWERFQWPDAMRLSLRPDLTVGALREAVVLANPGLKREAVGVLVSEKGWLRELRICHNRQFRTVACKRGAMGPGDSAALKIWRGI